MTTATPTPNRARLISAAEWVAAQDARRRLGLPNEWLQNHWLTRMLNTSSECGTACCIAGRIALEDGGKPAVYDYYEGKWSTDLNAWQNLYDGATTDDVMFPGDTETTPVRWYARDALGLTEHQAGLLFDAGNDYATVIEVIKDILAGNV